VNPPKPQEEDKPKVEKQAKSPDTKSKKNKSRYFFFRR